jgi:protein TonB
MENVAILTADVLDIIFEGRNKEYGAYDLRKTYNRRLTISIAVTLSLILLLFVGYVLAGNSNINGPVEVPDTVIVDIKPPVEEPVPVKPPPLPPPEQPVQTIRNTTPVIMKDEDVPEEEKPPVQDDMENTRIGLANQKGITDDNVIAPPADDGNKGIIELPKKKDVDSIFISVQIESSYPGGRPKWERFLNGNLQYPQQAQDNEIEGTVVVQFVVDIDGTVSRVEVLSGPEELKEAALRVIKKSGKWIPAVQNGTHVKSYKRQPIVFRLDR